MSTRVPAGAVRRMWPAAVFISSILLSLVVGGVLLASHTPFQANPGGLSALARDVATNDVFANDVSGNKGGWQAIHLLSTTCSCSRGVAEHLIERGPMMNLKEQVVLAGNDPALARRLTHAGFPVRVMDPETIAQRYGIAGAPWLLFVSAQGEVRYQGGYTPAHARSNYQDQQIWASISSGGSADALPVLGCALGKGLQRRLDPLGLKYSD